MIETTLDKLFELVWTGNAVVYVVTPTWRADTKVRAIAVAHGPRHDVQVLRHCVQIPGLTPSSARRGRCRGA